LTSSKLANTSAAAINLSLGEGFRQQIWLGVGSSPLTDPDPGLVSREPAPQSSGLDLMEIWRLLPALNEIPDEKLQGLPSEIIFGLNTALIQGQKSAAKLSTNARLALNAKKIASNPTEVGGGVDNRKTLLHPGRFLGGAICSNPELWLAGRRIHGDKGPAALGAYDLDSVGCGGCVTAKGWEALHNPASSELKLKMFYLPNVTNTSVSAKRLAFESGEELSLGESLKEIGDLESYRTALNTAREALHSVMPWNRSISAIVGFMHNTNYLEEALGKNPKRAAILSEFTDYIFGRNALNWENGVSFLTAEEIHHAWNQWRGKRAALFARSFDKQGQSKKLPPICRRYQMGLCPKQGDKECKSTFGTTLKHICNKYTGAGRVCGKEHPRKDHK